MSDLIVSITRDLPADLRRQHILFAGTADPRDRRAIGFLPWPVFEVADSRGDLITLTRNGDLVGFLLARANKDKELHIVQTWVRQDARLIEHGRALVDFADKIAQKKGLWQHRLWCATDLAANFFWTQLGYRRICWRWGSKTRYRKHWLYTRPVTVGVLQDFGQRAPQEALLLERCIPQSTLLP